MARETTILAVAGKGGGGGPSPPAASARLLSEAYPDRRILAIDADPAVGLAWALGVEVRETLDDIRKSIVSSVEDGAPRQAIELLGEARFRILDTMVEERKFAFLAIGRPESAGCYCTVNAYLKEVITLLAGDFDYVVIDGEAGVEQINRRVMEKVTHLVLVTDPSRRGVQVAQTIRRVAEELVMYRRCGVVVNRLEEPETAGRMDLGGLEPLAMIPTDRAQAGNDVLGKSVFDLPPGAAILRGAAVCLGKLGILPAGAENGKEV